MKFALMILSVLAGLLTAAGAHADSPDDKDDQSYELPAIVHGRTSMRKAMRSGSTFSFKLFQSDEPQKPQPHSYPEPSFDRR